MLEVQQGTTAAQLKDILAGPPHGLPVTGSTKVLRRAGGALMSLANTEKVTKDVVLLNIEPGPRPAKPDAAPPPRVQEPPPKPAPPPAMLSPVRVTVRTTAEGFRDWKVDVDVLPNTTVSQLREILARAPMNLQLRPEHKSLQRGKYSNNLVDLGDQQQVPRELFLRDFAPHAASPARRPPEQDAFRQLTEQEKGGLWQRLEEEKAVHHMLPPQERRTKSWGRAIASTLAQMRFFGVARRGTAQRPFCVWVVGASAEVELALAEAGAFLDANFLDREPMDVMLVGEELPGHQSGSPEPAEGEPPRIRSVSWGLIQHWPNIPRPDMNVVLCKGEALAQWLGALPRHSVLGIKRLLAATTLLSFRAKVPEEAAQTLARSLGDRQVFPVSRCDFSALAGDPAAEYDDNGWFTVFRDLESIIEVNRIVSQSREREGERRDLGEHDDRSKIAATFWGIIDLKYDPSKPILERVKVLETGDGRSSRFSHAGAEIPKRFKDKYRLDEGANSGKHAVVSANKKLTHDLMETYGYSNLVPRQACCPRVYDPGLAERIIYELGVGLEELVVLKLCNRSRAAGVLPVPAGALDGVLREILQPPEAFEQWLEAKLAMGTAATLQVEWGCYEEQLRHWWSNECPHFVAEQFCTSMLTEKDGKEYDGTMRIAFAISRRNGESKKKSEYGSPKSDYSNPLLEYTPPAEELLVDWIGGYWKLPKEDVESINIRASVISAARTAGTAYVDNEHLHEVYAAMGDSVQQLFGGSEPSPKMLAERYSEQPELATYLTARLAIAMRDLSRVRMALKIASSIIVKAEDGPVKRSAESFLNRGYGVLEAMTPPYKWPAARDYFAESVAQLPTNAAALYLLGMAELELGNSTPAKQLMERSLLLDLDFKAPYVNLGVVYLRLRKFDAAIEVSEALLKRHPESPQCHYHIGVACYQKAQHMESTVNLRLADKRKEVDTLKQRAIAELMESRECEEGQRLLYRGIRGGPGKQDSPWLDADDEMIESLKKMRSSSALGQSARLAPVGLPDNVGWRFYGWRN